ncbi:hypothetical protein ACJJTC_010475 [Scirpophaga incertulas]
MNSESLPEKFQKTTEVLPLPIYGLTSVQNFCNVEKEIGHQEWLRRAGLTQEEIILYHEKEAGLLFRRRDKMEISVLRNKLEIIYTKIKHYKNVSNRILIDKSSTPKTKQTASIAAGSKKFYPEGHPIHDLKQLDENLFGHLKVKSLPVTKRRKILRRLERKKERILQQNKEVPIDLNPIQTANGPCSRWDVREKSSSTAQDFFNEDGKSEICFNNKVIGSKQPTVYTIKDNKIVRLDPVDRHSDEFRAVDIVVPINIAETKLLEGTKMSLKDIMKMERFKDYKSGTPSKVLYLKNIAPTVTSEQLLSLFKQFTADNGGVIDVRLMTGRMRGQAFVSFKDDIIAAQALDKVNGTILSGRPIIMQFGRNSNRLQTDENR